MIWRLSLLESIKESDTERTEMGEKISTKTIADNRKARHDYFIAKGDSFKTGVLIS